MLVIAARDLYRSHGLAKSVVTCAEGHLERQVLAILGFGVAIGGSAPKKALTTNLLSDKLPPHTVTTKTKTMRTKALMLAAALCVAGAVTAAAQAVYSVNTVGYINLEIKPGFQMVANQLIAADSSIGTLMPEPPGGTQVFAWNGAGFDTFEFIGGIGWFPNGDVTLTPGTGAFVNNPTAASFPVTLVGEVPERANSNITIPVGFSIASSAVPQKGVLADADDDPADEYPPLGFPGDAGNQVFKWTGSAYDTYEFIGGIGWFPGAAKVEVGEAFFVNSVSPVPLDWTRDFVVSP